MAVTRKGIVLAICAPSGTGKTTLVKKFLTEYPHFGYSISYTTRAPREGEVDGVDYHFTTVQDFKSKRDEGFFAEWAKVHGGYYGTPLESTLSMLDGGQDILFDVDVQGAAQLRLNLPAGLFVFILPPSMKELRVRLDKRGTDTEEVILQRLHNAEYEINQAHWFDSWIINDDLDVAYDKLRSAYIATTLQPKHYPMFVENMLNDKEG